MIIPINGRRGSSRLEYTIGPYSSDNVTIETDYLAESCKAGNTVGTVFHFSSLAGSSFQGPQAFTYLVGDQFGNNNGSTYLYNYSSSFIGNGNNNCALVWPVTTAEGAAVGQSSRAADGKIHRMKGIGSNNNFEMYYDGKRVGTDLTGTFQRHGATKLFNKFSSANRQRPRRNFLYVI